MTIRAVDTIALSLPFEIGGPKPLFAGKLRNMEILLVRVETGDGLIGWGEAFGYAVWPATRAAVQTLIAPLAIGRDERDIPALTDDLARKLHLLGRTGPVVYALSGFDIALWDLAGKAAGRPLAALLGGAKRSSLAAYASLMRYGDAELVSRNAREALRRGFGAVKLHEIEPDLVRAARESVGPAVKLMMDTNCPWTVGDALEIAAAVRPYDLYWFEEPVFPPEDHAALTKLRSRAGIRIAAGENATSVKNFEQMFNAGAVDFAQPSVTKIDGVGALVEVARLARSRDVALAPHSPYFGPGLLATVQIAAALDDECLVEYSFADLGASPLGDAIAVVDGRIAVPNGPGLGRDPDPAVIARYAVS